MLICKSECQDVVGVKDVTMCQEKLNTEIRNRQTDTNMLGRTIYTFANGLGTKGIDMALLGFSLALIIY